MIQAVAEPQKGMTVADDSGEGIVRPYEFEAEQ